MLFYPRAEVIPGVWVGSAKDAADTQFLARMGMVINCTKRIPFYSRTTENIRIRVDDATRENAKMFRAFPSAVAAIDRALQRGHNVLIHCHAGMQRSCAVCAAYVMHLQKEAMYRPSATHAMEYVKERKRGAFQPRPTFLQALTAYETE